MKDCNCIFCKIANGEIPSSTVYEDEDFRVMLMKIKDRYDTIINGLNLKPVSYTHLTLPTT